MRVLLPLSIFLFVSLGAAEAFGQCDCARYPDEVTAMEELKASDVVFSGTVAKVKRSKPDKNGGYFVTVTFEVTKVWKGKLVRILTVKNDVYGCINGFDVGENWFSLWT